MNYAKNAFYFLILLFNLNCSSQTDDALSFEEYSIAMLQNGYIERKFSITDVVEYYLNAIESIDKNGPNLNSIISVNPDAMKVAKMLDSSLSDLKSLTPLWYPNYFKR